MSDTLPAIWVVHLQFGRGAFASVEILHSFPFSEMGIVADDAVYRTGL